MDDEENEERSESINPYNKYKNCLISYKSYLQIINIRDILYEKKSKKYYIFLGEFYKKKGNYLLINLNISNKKRKNEIINIIFEKYMDEDKDNDFIINKLNEVINLPDFLIPIKKGEKETKNEVIIINESEKKNFSYYKNIKIYYLNYLNIKYSLTIMININWKLKNFFNMFVKMYHIPNTNNQNQSTLTFIIKNEKYTGKELSSNKKLFLPLIFDYEKDYVFVLENENFDTINIDLGSKNSKYNFKEEKIPHIVFSSYNNFCVESIIVSNKLSFLECEIYVFKDDYYFNLERNIGKYNFKKAKDALSSTDWKSKCNYVTSIKSIKSSKYKNNDDVISFSILPRLILNHNKSYVFLITSPNININVFNSGCGDQGLFIVSMDDKAILNGFICRKISDLALDNSMIY